MTSPKRASEDMERMIPGFSGWIEDATPLPRCGKAHGTSSEVLTKLGPRFL
jgi:hypothetical protein